MKAKPYVVMVKPVASLCNMECFFCYYTGKGSHEDSPAGSASALANSTVGSVSALAKSAAGSVSALAKSAIMSDEVLERLIRQYMESAPGPIVSFTWHGGEPTLAGIGFFKRAVELQKKYLPEGWTAWNNLQTNGLLINDEWCSFLSTEKFQVGLSIDGTASIHDKYRPEKNQKANSKADSQASLQTSSYKKAATALMLLRSYNLQPDLICTVTSDTAKRPLDVYRALREFNTGWIQFIPIVKREASPEAVSAEAYGKFLCDVFDEWIINDLGKLDVQLFAEVMNIRAGERAGLCTMAETCGRALIAERDGSIYSCDHFVREDFLLGNIKDTHLGILADSAFQIKFGNDKRDALPSQCLSCTHLRFCRGGCPKDRFIPAEDGKELNYQLNFLCQGYKMFFSYVEPALNIADALARQGHGTETIREQLREMILLLWKDVGRNDPCPCKSGLKAKHCCWHKKPGS